MLIVVSNLSRRSTSRSRFTAPPFSLRILFPNAVAEVLLCVAFLFGAIGIHGCNEPSSPPRKDKITWQVFSQSASTLADNNITAIFMDNSRQIWLATGNGVSCFSRGSWTTLRDSLYNPGGLGHRVNCIVQEKDRKSMWFGLTFGGVVRYSPFSSIQVWRRYVYPDLLYNVILSGTADVSDQSAYGEVWFTSVYGISRFVGAANETGTWVNYNKTNLTQLPSNQVITCGTKLDDNTIWFGTQSGGAISVTYGLTGLNWTVYPLPVDSRINSIAFDLQNTVWFGTWDGVWSFNVVTSKWTHITYQSAGVLLPTASVNAVVTNHQNLRWFGTDAGLAGWNDTTWVLFTTANSPLPSDSISALAYDFNQNLWIGTRSGVAVYNPQEISY